MQNGKTKTDDKLTAAANGGALKHAPSAQRVILAELKCHIMEGKNDLEIQDVMMLTPTQFAAYKKSLYAQESEDLRTKTTEDVFLEYKWAQEQCIRELDDAKAAFDSEKGGNAIVGAIKAKSEIIDKVMQIGQSMGVITKTPETKLVLNGHIIAGMSDADLRKEIAKEMGGLAQAMAKYGEVNMDGEPISDGPVMPPIFSEPKRTGMNVAGPSKAAAARKSQQIRKLGKVIDVG